MKLAFIIGPQQGVKPWKDTSYILMLAAYQRVHEVAYLDQCDLHPEHKQLMAGVKWINVYKDNDRPFEVTREDALISPGRNPSLYGTCRVEL